MSTTLPITPETITRTTLDNGLVVLVKSNPNNPSVTLRGRVRAGGLYDTDKTAGLAHYATAAFQRGTRKRTFQKLNEELDRAGMSFGIGAGLETIGFSGKSLVEDFDHLLDLASDVLLRPTFPKDEVEKLRNQILTDLKEAEQDTQHVAYRDFRELCYPPLHPYHRLSEGRVETIKRIPIDVLESFHDRYVRPDMATVVIVGDISSDLAVEKIERAFGRWKARGLPPAYVIPEAPPPAHVMRKESPLPGKTQLDIILGTVGVRRTDPDYYALNLGDLILGRLGLYGRLGASVRDKQGLAYYVYSGVEASLGPGPWAVHAGVNPKNLDAAIRGIVGEIQKVRAEPVSADELGEAKDFVTGSLALRLETNDGVAAMLADIELFDLGMDYLQRYPNIIRSISADQILAVMEKHLPVDNYALAIAGPLDGN
jgi:zinc protease